MPITTPTANTFDVVPLGAPAQINATTVNPTELAAPVAETSQTQLTGILNKGGALMQQAAAVGNQQAASRGLLNSSMGIQAAQKAVYDYAVPIATNDANTINTMGTFNAGQKNQTLQSNANTANTVNQFNAQNENSVNQFNAQNANAASQWNAGQQNEAVLKAMDINSRETLGAIEANYKTLMQTNSSASDLYTQVMKNISDINMSIDVEDKATAIQSQMAYLNSGLTMIENLNGVSGLVTF